jgi:hypothetical protein
MRRGSDRPQLQPAGLECRWARRCAVKLRLNKRTALIATVVVALVAAGVLAASARSLYEVEAKGRNLLPYDAGRVYKVRVFDSFTMYADGESKIEADTIEGILLVSTATAALIAFLLLRAWGASRRQLRFYLITFLGIGYLALDELFSIHETIGHNMRFLGDLPGVERPDDVIFASYGIPALAFLLYFRDVFLGSRRGMILIGLGVALFGLSAVSDIAAAPFEEAFSLEEGSFEEAVELLGVISLTAGFATLIGEHLSQGLGLPRRPAEPGPSGGEGRP